ncbi:MAG: PSD1 and planctomycete cytochrome C domain-containing protein [Planctomycetota bacterium]
MIQRLLAVVAALFVPSVAAYAIDFESDIEPILQDHCFDCHGPDEQEGQLRLDRLSGMRSGGNSGEPAIVPTKPDESYLLKLIRHEVPGKQMPPDESLSAEQIARFEQWILSGARTPARYGPENEEVELSHWAFQPVQRNETTELDDLIGQRLNDAGLTMSPRADRRTLIRRLYLVMHGLPPTPEQVDAFVHDGRSDAWQRLIEEVLASPDYGRRWATHWLDLVRFGETHGFETNRERPHAWHYRDWVIQSFNDDKPYDQFVLEQLAGDAVGAPVGTGFLVAGPYDQVKGQDPKLGKMQRMNELDDMINTTGTAFLGLTTGCARCHNHKFDPIRQRDYYAMQAVFAGVHHSDRELPITPRRQRAIVELDQRIEVLKDRLERFVAVDQPANLVLDESNARHAIPPEGQADKSGYRDGWQGDSKYTWWKNSPDKEIVRYQSRASGRYRVWISWGSGYATHSTNARYVLRSKSGDVHLGTVDQRLDATGKGSIDNVAKWSGFYNAGVHQLSPESEVLLFGGGDGSAITADVIVLQPEHAETSHEVPPTRRVSVNAKINEERFQPILAHSIRFSIADTNNHSEACIDELEVYAGTRNVALASEGAVATSSGNFVHELHKLEHVNDGEHGNSRSWIVASNKGGYVQIKFAQPTKIDRIVWGRDRTGRYADRLAVDYRVEAASESGAWTMLASSEDRHADVNGGGSIYRFDRFPEPEANDGRRWLQELNKLQQERESLVQRIKVYAGTFSQPGPTYRLYRGEPDAQRERIAPGGLEMFSAEPMELNAPEQTRRLQLARWIVSEQNPLTARVIVNRLWQFHFGIGIVDTPSDFGLNGSRPTHPDLLDWLAKELVENGWSLKHIHRCILRSKTWCQDSRPNASSLRTDAATRLLWRFPPRRLEAEGIRDSILFVAETLVTEDAGGPGFSPFEVQMENVRHYHPKQSYGPEDWRRMIFMTRVRQEREHVFGAFDCPDASMVVPRRSRSTTPLQALNLLNSHFVIQQSELFAQRLQQYATNPSDQVRRAWHLCFQRDPTDQEMVDSLSFIQQEGLSSLTRALLNTNEFVFIP